MLQVVAKPGPVLLSGGLITSRFRLILAQRVEGGIEHTGGTQVAPVMAQSRNWISSRLGNKTHVFPTALTHERQETDTHFSKREKHTPALRDVINEVT